MVTGNAVIYILLVLILAINAVICMLLIKTIEHYNDASDYMKVYTDMIVSFYKSDDKFLGQITNCVSSMEKSVKACEELSNGIWKQYTGLVDAYNILSAQHIKLLDCWKSIEERYDQSFDQFKYCCEELKELKDQYKKTPILRTVKIDSDEEDVPCINCDRTEIDCENCEWRYFADISGS